MDWLFAAAAVATIIGTIIALRRDRGWPWSKAKKARFEAWSIGVTHEGRLRVQYEIANPSEGSVHIRGLSAVKPIGILVASNNAHVAASGAYRTDVKAAQAVSYDRRIPAGVTEGGTLVLVHERSFVPGQDASFQMQTDQGTQTLTLRATGS